MREDDLVMALSGETCVLPGGVERPVPAIDGERGNGETGADLFPAAGLTRPQPDRVDLRDRVRPRPRRSPILRGLYDQPRRLPEARSRADLPEREMVEAAAPWIRGDHARDRAGSSLPREDHFRHRPGASAVGRL